VWSPAREEAIEEITVCCRERDAGYNSTGPGYGGSGGNLGGVEQNKTQGLRS
jgi:hypothetical protein